MFYNWEIIKYKTKYSYFNMHNLCRHNVDLTTLCPLY